MMTASTTQERYIAKHVVVRNANCHLEDNLTSTTQRHNDCIDIPGEDGAHHGVVDRQQGAGRVSVSVTDFRELPDVADPLQYEYEYKQ